MSGCPHTPKCPPNLSVPDVLILCQTCGAHMKWQGCYYACPQCTAEDAVMEFKRWLSKPGNGDAPCTCGHPLHVHLADLSGCGDCNQLEPVHLRCPGWNFDGSTVQEGL